jgi:hypothetical protein
VGLIGNALKRGLGLDKKKDGVLKKSAKKIVKLIFLPGFILIILVALIALLPALHAARVADFVSDRAEDIGEFFSGGGSSGGGYSGGGHYMSHISGTPTNTVTPTPDPSASGTPTVSPTVAVNIPTYTGVEELVAQGGHLTMTQEEREEMMLEEVSIEDLVNGTLNPFGTAGDGDPRFKDITIKTERKLHVRKHPSGEGEAQYREQTRSSMWAAKEAEYNAAVSAAAVTPTATPEPSTTSAPTGSATPTNAPTSSPEPPAAPTPNPGPTAPSAGRTEASVPFVENTEREERDSEVCARPADPIGFSGGDGNTVRPTTRPTATVRPTTRPTTRPTGTASPTVTQAPTLTISVTPDVSVSPTGTPSVSPTNTGTPTPTSTPIPTPTWTQADEDALNAAVAAWVEENTYEDDITDYIETTISGEQLRTYANSLHTPWQTNYCMAVYMELYEFGTYNSVNSSISTEAAQMVFDFGNLVDYKLKVDYWDGTWEDREILYAEKEAVLGDCFIDNSADHTAEPVEMDDETDILTEESFVPIVLFTSIDGWAVRNIYGDRLDSVNDYGYYNQKIMDSDISATLDGFFSYTDMELNEVEIFLAGMEAMPEPERFESQLLAVTDMFEPGMYGGMYIDLRAFTHLAAGEQGAQSVYMALQIVNRGAVYSQENRQGANSYDCSSLVCRVYMELGINLSWGGNTDTDALAHYFVEHNLVVCRGYDESQMQVGDVILWSKPSRPDHYLCVYHAGLYAGDGMIVDASSSRGHVVYRQMWGQEQVVIVGRPSAGMGTLNGEGDENNNGLPSNTFTESDAEEGG